MIEVAVVLMKGGLPSTAIAPMEIFSCAGVLYDAFCGQSSEPLFRVRAVTATGKPTSSFIPVTIRPTCSIAEVRKADLIIVPSSGAVIDEILARNQTLIHWLRRWHKRGAAIAGICSGVALLAEAGLLDSRPATTHWALADQFAKRFPKVQWLPERFITESEKIFCSGGVYASIDLALYLVEKFCGHKIAMETAKALLLQTPRMWQATYAAEPPAAAHGDEPIGKAQRWLFKNFREAVTIEELAARVAMSPRNFARRFKIATGETPLAYLHCLRIDAAKHLLENERMNVHDVSQAVGYEDVIFFRRLFKRYTGVPPREYRVRFGISDAAA